MKPGKSFWIARDKAGGKENAYLIYDTREMKLDNKGFYRRSGEALDLDSDPPDLDEMDSLLTAFGPKLRPGEQRRVRICVL